MPSKYPCLVNCHRLLHLMGSVQVAEVVGQLTTHRAPIHEGDREFIFTRLLPVVASLIANPPARFRNRDSFFFLGHGVVGYRFLFLDRAFLADLFFALRLAHTFGFAAFSYRLRTWDANRLNPGVYPPMLIPASPERSPAATACCLILIGGLAVPDPAHHPL